MRVREAAVGDAAGIARVHVDSWRTTYAGIVPDDVLARLSYERRESYWAGVISRADAPEFVYIVEDETGQIVGFASGGPERAGDPLYQGELYAIYLLATHQRHGLGRRLTQTVAERLVRQGRRSMLVWVLASNPARRFYEALGGQPAGVKTIEMGGEVLEEVAYGWTDTRELAARAQTLPAPPSPGLL